MIYCSVLGHTSDHSNNDNNTSKDIGLKYLLRQSPNKMVIFFFNTKIIHINYMPNF